MTSRKVSYRMSENINEKNLEEIKKDNKEKLPVLILVFIVSGIIGFFGGGGLFAFLSVLQNNDGFDFATAFLEAQNYLTLLARPTTILIDFIFFIMIVITYKKACKAWNSIQDEDLKYEKTDRYLSLCLIEIAVSSILNLVIFGVALYNKPGVMELLKELFDKKVSMAVNTADLVLAIFPLMLFGIYTIYMQRKCVDFIRTMYPEKKGSVYDLKFNKVWYESCDEAERIRIGNASYKAFKVTNILCFVLALAFMSLGMVFEIGVLPFVIPALIAVVMNLVYGFESLKNNI